MDKDFIEFLVEMYKDYKELEKEPGDFETSSIGWGGVEASTQIFNYIKSKMWDKLDTASQELLLNTVRREPSDFPSYLWSSLRLLPRPL